MFPHPEQLAGMLGALPVAANSGSWALSFCRGAEYWSIGRVITGGQSRLVLAQATDIVQMVLSLKFLLVICLKESLTPAQGDIEITRSLRLALYSPAFRCPSLLSAGIICERSYNRLLSPTSHGTESAGDLKLSHLFWRQRPLPSFQYSQLSA